MRTVLCCMAIVLLTLAGRAEEYCSLIVKPVDPAGWEVAAEVTVEQQGGRRLEKENITQYTPGGLRFCDLGLSPVTVTVETGCSHVVIRNVKLTWGETRTIPVYAYRCLPDEIPQTCKFLLRFVDSEYKTIKGVSFKMRAPREETIEGDDFGRIFVELWFDRELVGTGIASWYNPLELRLQCTRANDRMEQRLMMTLAEQR